MLCRVQGMSPEEAFKQSSESITGPITKGISKGGILKLYEGLDKAGQDEFKARTADNITYRWPGSDGMKRSGGMGGLLFSLCFILLFFSCIPSYAEYEVKHDTFLCLPGLRPPQTGSTRDQ